MSRLVCIASSRILAAGVRVVETPAKGAAAPDVSLLPAEPEVAAFASLLALALAMAVLALDALRPLLVAQRADDEADDDDDEDVAAGIRDGSEDGANALLQGVHPNSRMEHTTAGAAAAATNLIFRK